MLDKLIVLKFIKFCVVGFSGLVIDFGITYLLKEKAKINKFVANSFGFAAAASSNYFLNRVWTFESHNQHIAIEYFSFFFIAIIGLLINNLTIRLLADKLKFNFYFSKIIATGIVTLWNFSMNFFFTFSA